MASGIPGPPMPPTMPDTAAGLADLLQNTTSGLVQVLQMSQRSDEVAAEAARRDRQEQRNVAAEQMALMQQQAQAAVIEAAEAYGHGALTRATTFRNALDTGNSAEAMAQYASFVETYLDTDPANPKFFSYKDASFPATLLKNANPMVEEARKIFSAVARAPGVVEIDGQKVSMMQALDMGHKDPNVATQLLQSVPPGSESRKAMLSMFRNSLKIPKGQTSLGTVLLNNDVSYVDAQALSAFSDQVSAEGALIKDPQRRDEFKKARWDEYNTMAQQLVARSQTTRHLMSLGVDPTDAQKYTEAGKARYMVQAAKRFAQSIPNAQERSAQQLDGRARTYMTWAASEFEKADIYADNFVGGILQARSATAAQESGIAPTAEQTVTTPSGERVTVRTSSVSAGVNGALMGMLRSAAYNDYLASKGLLDDGAEILRSESILGAHKIKNDERMEIQAQINAGNRDPISMAWARANARQKNDLPPVDEEGVAVDMSSIESFIETVPDHYISSDPTMAQQYKRAAATQKSISRLESEQAALSKESFTKPTFFPGGKGTGGFDYAPNTAEAISLRLAQREAELSAAVNGAIGDASTRQSLMRQRNYVRDVRQTFDRSLGRVRETGVAPGGDAATLFGIGAERNSLAATVQPLFTPDKNPKRVAAVMRSLGITEQLPAVDEKAFEGERQRVAQELKTAQEELKKLPALPDVSKAAMASAGATPFDTKTAGEIMKLKYDHDRRQEVSFLEMQERMVRNLNDNNVRIYGERAASARATGRAEPEPPELMTGLPSLTGPMIPGLPGSINNPTATGVNRQTGQQAVYVPGPDEIQVP